VAAILLLAVFALLASRLTQLLVLLILALLIAYLLNPMAVRLTQWLRLPRWAAILLVYLALFLIFAGTTTGIGLAVSQQLIGLFDDLESFSRDLPLLVESLLQSPIQIGRWTLDLSELASVEALLGWVGGALEPLFSSAGSIIASVAGATASFVGLILLGLILSIYLLVDYGVIGAFLMTLVPPPYRRDFQTLFGETSGVWQAFFRGQLVLGLAVGVVTAVVLSVLRLRFSLGLGLLAGILEFIPTFGPIIAGVTAVLVALFQKTNAWGLPPVAYAAIVTAAAILIQQAENNILVPRIIGRSLKLHPLVVLLAAMAGGILGGVVGILLAAPIVATLRLWFGYVYNKIIDAEPWRPPEPVLREPSPAWRNSVERVRRWRSRRLGGGSGPERA
jgi:predicted PurR-regulated permease PerM